MRFLILAATVVAALGVSGTVINRSARGLVDETTWKVESSSNDHITYVRRTTTTTEAPTTKVDCNLTTTTPPSTFDPRRLRKSRPEVRSGGTTSRRRTQKQTNNYDGFDGDHVWAVEKRTDDHITYVRRSSSSQGQEQGQVGQPGELKRLGSGNYTVLARVVIPGKDDDLTEEGLLESHPRVSASTSNNAYSGYPTNDLVHPYVRKGGQSKKSNRTKSLKSGDQQRGHQRRGWKSATAATTTVSPLPPNIGPSDDDTPPRVGEVLNGWQVISKSKDHISWQRWGTTHNENTSQQQLAAAQVSNIYSRNERNQNRLKSLRSGGSDQIGGNRRNSNNRKLIPNAEGELIEGFPKVFNTYSRAYYVNERDINQAGSIRTSLSDTSKWSVGDELAGWRVINKDHRGLIWEKIKNQDQDNGDGFIVDEEDLLEELNKKGKDEEESSSESDSSSESKSNEDDDKVYKGPPGTWYLAKETRNLITWKRDNLPQDIVFEMEAYPRVGEIVSGWKVRSKSRGHITWVRVNNDGSEMDSNEQIA